LPPVIGPTTIAYMMNGIDWVWYAVGAAVVIPLGIAHARARYRRWVRRHSYVATVEFYEGSER
jgi:hypothetical protein